MNARPDLDFFPGVMPIAARIFQQGSDGMAQRTSLKPGRNELSYKTAILLVALALLVGCQKQEALPSSTLVSPVDSPVKISNSEAGEIRQKVSDRIAHLATDEFKKVSFWTSRPNENFGASPSSNFYIVVPDDHSPPTMRIVETYVGPSWVFFNRLQILAGKELVLDRQFERNDVKRDAGSGFVIESVDFEVGDLEAKAASKIGASENVIVRFSGNGQHDHEMSIEEKRNFARLAELYDDIAPLKNKKPLGLPRLAGWNDNSWRAFGGLYYSKGEAVKKQAVLKTAGVESDIEKSNQHWVLYTRPKIGRIAAEKDRLIVEATVKVRSDLTRPATKSISTR